MFVFQGFGIKPQNKSQLKRVIYKKQDAHITKRIQMVYLLIHTRIKYIHMCITIYSIMYIDINIYSHIHYIYIHIYIHIMCIPIYLFTNYQ